MINLFIAFVYSPAVVRIPRVVRPVFFQSLIIITAKHVAFILPILFNFVKGDGGEVCAYVFTESSVR